MICSFIFCKLLEKSMYTVFITEDGPPGLLGSGPRGPPSLLGIRPLGPPGGPPFRPPFFDGPRGRFPGPRAGFDGPRGRSYGRPPFRGGPMDDDDDLDANPFRRGPRPWGPDFDGPEQEFHCRLCNITVGSEYAFERHMQSRKHRMNHPVECGDDFEDQYM